MASTLKVRRGGAWVAIPDGKLSVKTGGVWRGPQKVYIKRGGVWVDTGFVGKPTTPAMYIYGENYTYIQPYVTAPSSGAVTATLRVYLLNSSGAYLAGGDYAAGPGGAVAPSFSTSADTNYIIRAWTISAAGVLSDPVSIQRRTGHLEQGYNQANYGWSGISLPTIPLQIDGTSEYEYGGHPGAKAVDGDPGTAWVSGAFADPGAFAALVFQPFGGNRLLYDIRMTCWYNTGENPGSAASYLQTGWCGIWINGNLTYSQPVGAGMYKTWNVESYGWTLQNVTKFNISMTNLVPWPISYRAEIAEVAFTYRDWVIVSYTWIVTVAAAGNSYW